MRAINDYSNNCTLVAVREVTNLEDAPIIEAFLARKWVPGRGTYSYQYLGALQDLGFQVEKVDTAIKGVSAYVKSENYWGDHVYRQNPGYYMTVGQFAEAFPTGTFLASNADHAFVIRDGKLIDPNMRKTKMRYRIKSAWRVLNPGPTREPHKLAELTKDSVVVFCGSSHRRRGTKSALAESKALMIFLKRGPVPLRDLTKGTGYGMGDALWDQARGRLRVVQ